VTRASIAVERLGIPTVSLCCDGFKAAGTFLAKAEGFANLPFAVHPGHVNTLSNGQVYRNAAGIMTEAVVHRQRGARRRATSFSAAASRR
jgi:hypothetical protein